MDQDADRRPEGVGAEKGGGVMGMAEQEFEQLAARFRANAENRPVQQVSQMEVAKPAQRRGVMNKLEARFEREVLKPAMEEGQLVWYAFEGIKLRLADGAWYTPDFVAMDLSSTLLVFETKGHWREAARIRIKVAADKYPFRFQAVTRDRKTGEWQYEQFPGRRG